MSDKIEITFSVDSQDLSKALEAQERNKKAKEDAEEAKRIVREGIEKIKSGQDKNLDVVSLMPNAFAPMISHRFLFCMDGLDAFLTKKVERASYLRHANQGQPVNELVVHLHESVQPSTRQQVQDLIAKNLFGPLTAKIKMLDPIGRIIQTCTYSGMLIKRVDYSSLSYDNNHSAEVVLTLGYESETIEP